jgi:hypothetical protein
MEDAMARNPRKLPRLGPSDSSDTSSDRPNNPGTDTDAGGTGERKSVGSVPRAKDLGTDRVASDRDVGLGGGLDQAEEARRKKRER